MASEPWERGPNDNVPFSAREAGDIWPGLITADDGQTDAAHFAG